MLAIATHDTAGQFSSLWRVYLTVTVAVGVLVAAAIVLAAARFRRGSQKWPAAQPRSAPRLEAAWLALIAVMVAFLLLETYRTENREDALAATPAVRVQVTASQWQWRFAYRGTGVVQAAADVGSAHPRYATLVVPAGEPVEFDLRSADVLHGFFIPAMRYKVYAFPNSTNRFVLTFPRPGRMLGECSQFCGWDHAEMRFTVRVLSPAAFDHWLTARTTGRPA
jgi:cytochrome c oxidase subunit II